MQDKKSLRRHLAIIYVAYFFVLVTAVIAGSRMFVAGFRAGWDDAETSMDSGSRTYFVDADLAETIDIEGLELPEGVTAMATKVLFRVEVDEPLTLQSAFRVVGNSVWIYVLSVAEKAMWLAVVILSAVIIASLRRSIRNEQPISKRNEWRTRGIAVLLLAASLMRTICDYINNREAARVLADTDIVAQTVFSPDYWTILTGILMFFMAEVLSIGRHLGEEQRLTI